MDALSEFLGVVRVRGSLFSRAELSAPWGVRSAGMEDAIFHVILAGAGWVRVEGDDSAPRAFRAGDLLVLPHGQGHVITDAPRTPAMALGQMAQELSDDDLPVVRHNGGGPATSILCGTFQLDELCRSFLLPLLPPLLLVAGGSPGTAAWLETTLRVIADEQSARRPGAQVMVARMAEVLFVQVLRAWIGQAPDRGAGWLGALADPQLSRALGLMHNAPDHPWTASELAGRAGMSRSTFFARFTAVVGESPSAYLTRWRMHLAQSALRRRNLAMAQIASRVGYGSEAAFSRAFKKQLGLSPSAWRRQALEAASGGP